MSTNKLNHYRKFLVPFGPTLPARLAGISTAQSDRVHKDKTIEEEKILEESPS